MMNDIAKKATADRFFKAFEKENLSRGLAGSYIGLTPPQVSYLFNEKYWGRLGQLYWDKLLAWANSGYSLREYPRHHPEAALQPKTVFRDPVADALWQQSVDNVAKEAKSDTEKEKIVPETVKSEPIIKIKPGVLEKRKEELAVKERRASRGEMVDMLIEEKESLRAKIDAIDVLLKHYIS